MALRRRLTSRPAIWAAAAAIGAARGSDWSNLSATLPAGACRTTPGLPPATVTFAWHPTGPYNSMELGDMPKLAYL